MGHCVTSVDRIGWRRWRWSVSDLADRHGHFDGTTTSRSRARRAAADVAAGLSRAVAASSLVAVP